MLKDIEVTLYDIFGYLIPGLIFLTAIAILFWTIFFPNTSIVLATVLSFDRYKHFGDLRVKQLIMGFFVLREKAI